MNRLSPEHSQDVGTKQDGNEGKGKWKQPDSKSTGLRIFSLMNQNISRIACFIWDLEELFVKRLGPVSTTARLSLRPSVWPWGSHAGCPSLSMGRAFVLLSPNTHLCPFPCPPYSPHWAPCSLFVYANVITCPQGVPLNITLTSQQHNQLFSLAGTACLLNLSFKNSHF